MVTWFLSYSGQRPCWTCSAAVLATLAVRPPQLTLAQALAARSHKPTIRALLEKQGSLQGTVIAGQVFWRSAASSSLATVPTARTQSLSQRHRKSALTLVAHLCPNMPTAMKWCCCMKPCWHHFAHAVTRLSGGAGETLEKPRE